MLTRMASSSSSICKNPKLFKAISKAVLSPKFFSTQTTPFPSFRAAKSAILSESNPDKLAQLFEQSAHLPTFRRHRPIFHLSVRKLVRANRPDLVGRLLQSQQNDSSSSFVKSEGFWIRLLMLYSGAGMVDQATQTLFHYSQKGYFQLSEKSLCAILSVHLNNGMFEKLHQLFDTMPEILGIALGVVSNNLVLKAFVKENKIESARDWIEKMEKESDGNAALPKPNIDSYNILLGAYLKNGNGDGFDGVVKKILNMGLDGSLTTYNHRILRLCKNRECVRAKKLLDEMVSKGVKPNSASYNAIIDGFGRLADFVSARKVLASMLTDGHATPCSFTYYTLIRSMVKEGEFGLALEVFSEIIKRRWVPPFEAAEGLVRGLVKNSRVEEAKEVVDKMKRRLKGTAVEAWGKIEASLPL